MGIISEFKTFIAKGNAFDLAIGVIVGGAFAPVIKSMVDDVIMPVVSIPLGSVDFKNLYVPLSTKGISALKEAITSGVPIPTLDAAKAMGAVISYGNFLNAIVSFIILMFGVFILVKMVNILKRKEAADPKPPVPAPPTKEEALLTEIRDALIANKL